MKKRILLLILVLARASGLFWIARRLTAQQLRVLCYHGAALLDEDEFRPGLFVRAETFAARMAYLASSNYPVLSLDDALERLRDDTLPSSATVITIDDGWYGTFQEMVPVLEQHGFPSTLYVATHYLETQTQVLDVGLAYILWRARQGKLDLAEISDSLSGEYDVSDRAQCDVACEKLVVFGNRMTDPAERQDLLRDVCRTLAVPWQEIRSKRIASFMNWQEARQALGAGVDLQLHTHHHVFPSDNFEAAKSEINRNRTALSGLSDKELKHFCYPSGEYTEEQLPWLRQLAVESATTTVHGFNRRDTSRYELRRFLDSENITLLEFEAEMSGFFELVRRCGYSI